MKHNRLLTCMGILCAVLFSVSLMKLFPYFAEREQQERSFRQLEQITVEHAGDDGYGKKNKKAGKEQEETSGSEIDPLEESRLRYQALHEKNPDYWGWIRIAGTKLNYPVMHTPDDPEYYIHRDFEGNSSSRGVPFLDGRCEDDCGNYIIYGHHMKDGTMFTTLMSYTDQDFYREHKDIQLETEQGRSTYLIIAAFYSRAYAQNETGVFRYYQYLSLKNQNTFEEYAEQVKKAAIYDTGVTAVYGDQLMTLSTCDYSTENGRFVVVAKKLADRSYTSN